MSHLRLRLASIYRGMECVHSPLSIFGETFLLEGRPSAHSWFPRSTSSSTAACGMLFASACLNHRLTNRDGRVPWGKSQTIQCTGKDMCPEGVRAFLFKVDGRLWLGVLPIFRKVYSWSQTVYICQPSNMFYGPGSCSQTWGRWWIRLCWGCTESPH